MIERGSTAPRSLAGMEWRLSAILGRESAHGPVSLRSHPDLRGWAGLDLPVRTAGAAWSALDMAHLFRRIGRLDVELRDLVGGGHARLLNLVQTRRFDSLLRDVGEGSSFCAIAITEPEAGSDLHALRTVAATTSGGYVITGVKQHISRISECDHFIVFASTKRDGRAGITAFLVPKDAPGVEIEVMSPMGMNTVSWGRVIFREVHVPLAQRIGGEGQALSLFVRHFSYWRTMMAAVAVGSAQAAVEQAIAWMKQRHAFGGPIGRFTHLQQALAQHVARLRMASLLIDDVAAQLDARRWPLFDAAMAKAESIEAALAATDWCMSVLGAAGYATDSGIEKRYRDLAGLRIADGTTDVLRGQVARGVLGERIYELSLNRHTGHGADDDHTLRRFW